VVSIDDCARASKALQRWLDDSRLLGEDYVIEVSSPGIERRVARPQDFRRFAGRRVRVRCRTLVDGKRNFEGILEAAGEDGITVREGEQRFALSYAIVARANLAVEPREGGKGHGDQPQ
jgi:ribosome maturation factor RimP